MSFNKKNVLITGASSGIGYELSRVFAREGYNLILVARREEILNKMAMEFKRKYNTLTKVIAKDLTQHDAVNFVFDEVVKSGMNIDILINNAGMGSCGLFHGIDNKKYESIIQLNVTFLTCFTKVVAWHMIKRNGGKILNVASTGSYQPGPFTAVYYASKAYVLSFSQAIENELKPYNIVVSTLCPGATKTEFCKVAGKGDLKSAMKASKVAEIAYKGLLKNQSIIIPGTLNKFSIFMSNIMPGKVLAKIVGKIQKKAILNK